VGVFRAERRRVEDLSLFTLHALAPHHEKQVTWPTKLVMATEGPRVDESEARGAGEGIRMSVSDECLHASDGCILAATGTDCQACHVVRGTGLGVLEM
jgi:hypothetical protein